MKFFFLLETGFLYVALKPVLELVLVDQAGLSSQANSEVLGLKVHHYHPDHQQKNPQMVPRLPRRVQHNCENPDIFLGYLGGPSITGRILPSQEYGAKAIVM